MLNAQRGFFGAGFHTGQAAAACFDGFGLADSSAHPLDFNVVQFTDALGDLGIVLSGADRVEPALTTQLYDNLKIAVTRVSEDVTVEEEIASFETVFVADPNLPIDTQEVLATGAEGITRTRYRTRYENGEAVAEVLEDTWLAQEPADRRIAYGQKITPFTETMPDGTVITYWRKLKMLATSYNAESAGGNRTRTGDLLRAGIVAVDPRLIPLRSQVYVPGYGIADALLSLIHI